MSFTDKELKAVKEIVEKYSPIHSMHEKGIGWYHIEGIIERLEAAEACIASDCEDKEYFAWLKSKGEA